MNYVRTNGGTRIHRANGCWWSRNAKTAVPWRWADGKSLEQIAREVPDRQSMYPCGHCFGMGAQLSWEYA
jgi:hypothetical protein